MRPLAERVSGASDALVVEQPVPRSRRVRRRGDAALIRGAQAGSDDDLEELFRRHWRRAYRVAYLIVHDHAAAEDIAQESFVAAIRTLDRFDRRRPFAPWLSRIVTNRSIDWARASKARREVDREPPDQFSPDQFSPDQFSPHAHSGVYSDEIVRALASLSPEHRAVVVLRYVLDYTPGEIAGVLELPRGTINSRLRRALDALEVKLR